MKKLIFLSVFVFIVLQSSALIAAKFYKCTNKDGHVVYQNKSCSGKQVDENVDIIDNGNTSGDDYGARSVPRYGSSNKYLPVNSDYDTESSYDSERLQRKLDKIRRDSDKRTKKYKKDKCKRYKSYSKASDKKLRYMKRNGYSLSEKKRYEKRAAMDKIDMDMNCGR